MYVNALAIFVSLWWIIFLTDTIFETGEYRVSSILLNQLFRVNNRFCQWGSLFGYFCLANLTFMYYVQTEDTNGKTC